MYVIRIAEEFVCLLLLFFFEIVFILSVEVAIALDLKPVSSLDFYNVSLFYTAKEVKKCIIFAPAGISPRGEIPKRHPSHSRVY